MPETELGAYVADHWPEDSSGEADDLRQTPA